MSSRKTSPDIDVFYENQLESNDTLMIFATARKICDCLSIKILQNIICNNIAQLVIEICGISGKQFLNLKKSLL